MNLHTKCSYMGLTVKESTCGYQMNLHTKCSYRGSPSTKVRAHTIIRSRGPGCTPNCFPSDVYMLLFQPLRMITGTWLYYWTVSLSFYMRSLMFCCVYLFSRSPSPLVLGGSCPLLCSPGSVGLSRQGSSPSLGRIPAGEERCHHEHTHTHI